MLSNTIYDKYGDILSSNISHSENSLECIQFYCSNCGNRYEIGFRYNNLIKQHVKYIKFIQ